MKTYQIVLFLLILCEFTFSQNIGEIKYATHIEASGTFSPIYGLNVFLELCAVDNNGFLYYGGTFNDTVKIGDNVFMCTNELDGYFCKSDTNNEISWVKHFRCSEVLAFNTYYDSNENMIYLFGGFHGQVIFDNDTLFSIGGADMFVAKLNTEGEFVQFLQSGGANSDRILCLTKDKEGNVIIGGEYYESSIIGDSVFNSPIGNWKEAFTAKLDSAFNFIWVLNGTGPENDKVVECTTDDESNIYITGNTFNSVTFGDIVLNEPFKMCFFSKISKDGEYIWAKQYGGVNLDCWVLVVDIISEGDGNFLISGNFSEKIIIGNDEFLCQGFYDIYFFSFDSEGNYLWARRYGGEQEDVSGRFYIDNDNRIYFAGFFQSEIDLGVTALSATGLMDVFLSEIDNNGNFVWAYPIGGTDINYSRTFCNSLFKINNMLYFGGMFEKDIELGDNHFYSSTLFDGYVAGFHILPTIIHSVPADSYPITLFPNPASDMLTIQFHLPEAGLVYFYLLDSKGNEIHCLNEKGRSIGQHQCSFDISGYPSGVYFIKIVSGPNTRIKKIIKID